MTPPDWAVKFHRPGTELRRVNDALYKLYGCSSVYDKEKQRALKITGKYLGSITEAGEFKESRKRIMEREIEELKSGRPIDAAEPKVGEVKDLGLSQYILTQEKECIETLKECFLTEWQHIAAITGKHQGFQRKPRLASRRAVAASLGCLLFELLVFLSLCVKLGEGAPSVEGEDLGNSGGRYLKEEVTLAKQVCIVVLTANDFCTAPLQEAESLQRSGIVSVGDELINVAELFIG